MKYLLLISHVVALIFGCASAPSSISAIDSDAYKLHVDAVRSFRNLDYRAAERYWSAALSIDTDYQDALFNRSTVRLLLEKKKLALNDIDYLIKLNPHYSAAYSHRGHIYQSMGNYSEAVRQFTKAYKLDSDNIVVIFNLANAYYALKMYQDSIIYYSVAIKKAPNESIYYFNRGVAYEKKGKYSRALKDYLESVKFDSTFSQGYFNAALMHIRENKLGLAIEAFSAAIIYQPDFFEAYHNRAIVNQHLGYYDKAKEDFIQAARYGRVNSQINNLEDLLGLS